MHDPARDAFVTLRGLRFHYREYGHDGRAVVLLHGVASNARIWLTAGPLLAEQYRVLALDQRGHGETDKPDDGYDFATIAGDLEAFIDTLGLERPVVAGHSWGGNDALTGLVLVDGGFLELAARPGMTWERAEVEMAPPDLTKFTPQQLVEMAQRWELGPLWSEEIEAALLGNFQVTEEGTLRPHLSRANHMQVVRALWEQRPSELYAKVRCPVLFALAERDAGGRGEEWIAMKREAMARAEALLPNCQVRWFADTIHDIPLHRPKELAQAMTAFIEGLSA